jgi:hypothetical protein
MTADQREDPHDGGYERTNTSAPSTPSLRSPVCRIRGDRVVDINTGNPVYRMRE